MKIRNRLFLLLCYLVTALTISFILFRQINLQRQSYIRQNEAENHSRLLKNAVKSVSQVQEFFTTDYSRWNLMVEAVRNNDQAFFDQEFFGTLEIYQVDAVSVFRSNLTQVYFKNQENSVVTEVPSAVFKKLPVSSSSPTEVFVIQDKHLLRYQVAIITYQELEAVEEPIMGYLVTAQVWNDTYIQKIAEAVGGTIHVQVTPPHTHDSDERIHVSLALPSVDDSYVYIVSEAPDVFVEIIRQISSTQELIVFAIGTLMVLGSIVLMQKWILSPLEAIINKFKKNGLLSLPASTLVSGNEFAILNELVDEFLNQGGKVIKQNVKYEELTTTVQVAMEELALSRKELAAQLEETKRLSQAVEVTSDAVIMTNAKGEIIYVNPAWERLNQYSLSEVQGKNPRLLKSNRTPNTEYRHMWKSLATGSSYVSENFINRRKDGSEYFARISVNPIQVKGKNAYFVGVAQDITERKNADTLKTDFISLASHQLRTPLTSIRWLIELLLDKKTPPTQRNELMIEIQASAMKMIAMVSALLNISRLESGRMSIFAEEIDVNKVLRRLFRDLKPFSDKHKVQLQLSEDRLPQIMADPLLLRELFYNLIHNAVQYSAPDSKVLVTTYRHDQDVLIEVRDSGIGIPLAEQAKIFEKFYRSSNAIKYQSDGTGLGLYLARLIVDTFGGKLTFQSTPGVGTTFSIVLPIKGQKSKTGEVTLTSLISSHPKQT